MDRPIARTAVADAELALKQEILRRSPFASLPGGSRNALLEVGRLDRFPRRHHLTEQGAAPQGLFLLGSGRIKLERVTGDRTFPLGHRGPGQLVGEAACIGGAASTETASVVDDVEVVTLPLEAFRRLLNVDPVVRGAMATALSDAHRAAEERLASLLLEGVEARLIGFLLDAAQRWGRAEPSGELIMASFTHADLASLIGSTRETVTLLLGKLKRANFIAFDRRRVIIRDRVALAQHAATA